MPLIKFAVETNPYNIGWCIAIAYMADPCAN